MYFNQRKWAAHASYSFSVFHTSCGTKNHFCAQAQDFRVVPWENNCIFIRSCLKTKTTLVKVNSWLLQLCITLTSDQYSVDLCLFTEFTFPFRCCLCWKLALRPYIHWALVKNPCSCHLLSSSISCRSDGSGQVGWSSGPWGKRTKGIVLFAYQREARVLCATSSTVYGS